MTFILYLILSIILFISGFISSRIYYTKKIDIDGELRFDLREDDLKPHLITDCALNELLVKDYVRLRLTIIDIKRNEVK